MEVRLKLIELSRLAFSRRQRGWDIVQYGKGIDNPASGSPKAGVREVFIDYVGHSDLILITTWATPPIGQANNEAGCVAMKSGRKGIEIQKFKNKPLGL